MTYMLSYNCFITELSTARRRPPDSACRRCMSLYTVSERKDLRVTLGGMTM